MTETSSVIVETVAKQGRGAGAVDRVVMPKFNSDAAKVKTTGMGLKKAYLHKQNQFVVQAEDAGKHTAAVALPSPS